MEFSISLPTSCGICCDGRCQKQKIRLTKGSYSQRRLDLNWIISCLSCCGLTRLILVNGLSSHMMWCVMCDVWCDYVLTTFHHFLHQRPHLASTNSCHSKALNAGVNNLGEYFVDWKAINPCDKNTRSTLIYHCVTNPFVYIWNMRSPMDL